MLSKIFINCIEKWRTSIKDKNYPFRTFVLSTIQDNEPKSRNVILRDFDPNKIIFTIYTDSRSNKIQNLNKSSSAQLLFYDSVNLLQVIVKAQVVNINSDLNIFNSLSEYSKRNYTSDIPPGTKIEDPASLKHGDKINFSQISFQALTIDCLQLNKYQNIRSFYSAENSWKGFYIAP